MSFDLLKAHDAIGWDFDGTLIGHPASDLLHAFILAYPKKRHVIVTFRTHGMEKHVWRDLGRYPFAPPARAFAGVLNISNAAWEDHEDALMRRGAGLLEGAATVEEALYREWKGMTCAQHGLTVLVDDMPELVEAGCRKHGVAYFHPDAFR
jgi:hypothetical protein